jgi:hypothetical protein
VNLIQETDVDLSVWEDKNWVQRCPTSTGTCEGKESSRADDSSGRTRKI